MTFSVRSLAYSGLLTFSIAMAACQGCRGKQTKPPSAVSDKPTLRLYLLSSVAGALEPCGCTKNQLGGFDKFASFVNKEKTHAPNYLVAGAGPLFFLNPTLVDERKNQDVWKAESISYALSALNFAAWSPGANDWAAGGDELKKLAKSSQGSLVGANVSGEQAQLAPFKIQEINGYKVAFVGLSVPKLRMGLVPKGLVIGSLEEPVRKAVTDAKAQGAQILVGLAAVPRGDVLRLLEKITDFQVVVVGKSFDQGEANDKPAPPQMLGSTLVVQTANHLQSVAVVDLYIRDKQLQFQDAAGVKNGEKRGELTQRIEELQQKIRRWEQNPAIQASDLEQRRKELEQLRKELQALETPAPPTTGSFFRYTMQEVRPNLGMDKTVSDVMLGYYKKVNEHNKTAFADRKPPAVEKDQSGYIGMDECAKCHPGAVGVWAKTPHAQAYRTLQTQFKEYNLDCVSCHVTGYGKPGGSTVTHNETLRNVQCEECHGPGSRHKAKPADKSLILGHPEPKFCVSECHHPPHVEDFDASLKMHLILGKGHGDPAHWPLPKK
jgi:hypothetical protein